MNLSDSDALASIRFSLGRFTTAQEIDRAIDVIKTAVKKLG
jgi:cysteine desulfurase